MLHSHLTTLHSIALILQLLGDEDGDSAEALLAGSGIRLADLQHPDIRITTAQEMRVCANARARCQALGLLLGQRMHVSSYGLLGYTLLSSATLGDALNLALDYPALLGTYFELSLQRDGDLVWLQADGYRDLSELETFSAEFCLASLRLICDDLLGRRLPLREARFRHARPDYEKAYVASFACPRRFDAERNAFGFDASWLEQRLPLADPVTHRDMRERCRQLNSEFVHRQAWVTRCRQLLASQLQEPPALDELARQLACSPRTLRRHLHDAGSSYQTLLDELRYERARDLLGQALPINHIAEVMGYSETASFRHAFQRWSGLSPSRFRA
ncbi:AraC family transcriptional regulator [Pseudomonas sp. PDM14]|uniref:AraC family transcriptional regulator n=1 Tax=Pseudomonas sp. PDM14 TaxID=2769288 RepID=UPI001783E3D0|nr:AraC family transcriptional regulator [Pseudomonas sp. PDM14]MBD9483203.1 AraC family transcriptional regulator [Pseudomonas sp. PDM14]